MPPKINPKMFSNIGRKIFFILLVSVFLSVPFSKSRADSSTTTVSTTTDVSALQEMISQKTEELNKLNEQKQAVVQKLNQISQSKDSLNSEVQSLNYKIDQLNLQIESNQISQQRIGLEIQSLNGDIKNAQDQVQERKQLIAKLMVEMEESDSENPLFTILGSNSLSDTVNKTSSAYILNKSLVDSLSELANLQDSLSQKVDEISSKKEEQKAQVADLVNTQYILQDQVNEKNVLLSQTKNQEQIYQNQMDQLDAAQQELTQTIDDMESKLRASFNPNLLPSLIHSTLSFPVENVIITQGYGRTSFARKAYKSAFHNGVDIGVPIGTPVYAAADGVVLRVDNNDKGTAKWRHYLYGKYIVISHSNNLATLYGHLSRQVVKAGDIIKRGQLIGYSGETGYAFGPHVHFGVFWEPELKFISVPPANGLVPVGVTIDPMVYLPDSGFTRDY